MFAPDSAAACWPSGPPIFNSVLRNKMFECNFLLNYCSYMYKNFRGQDTYGSLDKHFTQSCSDLEANLLNVQNMSLSIQRKVRNYRSKSMHLLQSTVNAFSFQQANSLFQISVDNITKCNALSTVVIYAVQCHIRVGVCNLFRFAHIPIFWGSPAEMMSLYL